MRLSNLNAPETGKNKSIVEGLHGGKEVDDEALIPAVDDLIPDEDADDTGLRIERGDVYGDPLAGKGELGEGRDVAVHGGDGHGDPGVGEGAQDVRVGVEDLDPVDDRLGPDEVGHLGRGREVVAEGAIVDADGGGGGEEVEEGGG